jgi:hypothetical protein
MTVAPLKHLGLLDLVLDALLLESPLLRISPPYRTLILASHTEVDTSATGRVALIALLPTQSTCEATCSRIRYQIALLFLT